MCTIVETNFKWLCKGREGWSLHHHNKNIVVIALQADETNKLQHMLFKKNCSIANHVLCGVMWHANTKEDKVYTSWSEDQQEEPPPPPYGEFWSTDCFFVLTGDPLGASRIVYW